MFTITAASRLREWTAAVPFRLQLTARSLGDSVTEVFNLLEVVVSLLS